MKNLFLFTTLILTSISFSQNNDIPNHPVKHLKIIGQIIADIDNDGKMDTAIHYQGLKNYSYSGQMAEDDTIQLVKIIFANKKVLETKPLRLETGKIKLTYYKKANELTIIVSPKNKNGIIKSSFPATKSITFKYYKQHSNLIAVKSESNSGNIIIKTNYYKKTKEYKDKGDGYKTLTKDKNEQDIWLKKVNFKETINYKSFIINNLDSQKVEKASEVSTEFKAYLKNEINNTANRK